MTDQAAPRPTRRSVLKGGGLAVAAPTLLPAAAPPRPMALVLPDAEVAGIGHHASPEILNAMVRGLRLELRREPHNGHDPHAVAIHLESGERIGYVPRLLNVGIAGLLDAGHTLAGEVTDPERREFETRLSGDQKPFPGRVILSEAGTDEEGRRRVRMADVRPRFRAYLTTGHAAEAPLPDPDAREEDPGWRRLAPEFEPEGGFRALSGKPHGFERGQLLVVSAEGQHLHNAAGRYAGSVARPEMELIRRARHAGLEVRAVVTRVREEKGEDGQVEYACPWVELRINGHLPAPDELEEQARLERLKAARITRDSLADHLKFVVRTHNEQEAHQQLLEQIAQHQRKLDVRAARFAVEMADDDPGQNPLAPEGPEGEQT